MNIANGDRRSGVGAGSALQRVGMRSPQPVAPQSPRIAITPRGQTSRRRDLLLDVPIAWRLTLGFLLAALIAGVAAGVPALQRAQALGKQSSFYESLLKTNTSLTTGASYLQLMDTETHQGIADAGVSHETLSTDLTAVQNLSTLYDGILTNFVQNDLLSQHADQVALLNEARDGGDVAQQRTLANSALRSWQVYRVAQNEVTQDLTNGDTLAAQTHEREQGEPTNADSLSALRDLIQFDGRIASSIHDVAIVEQQNQLATALIAGVLAFIAIAAVGWVISNTLVRRLRQLRKVTQVVEQGELATRVLVVGRDEIAGVTASVNGMLDTIVGLLDVTRRQRDALTNAAERLFTDMRVAGAGDLRVNASVSGDPIGMLGNAFNFTVGRFRRFVLRTQTSADQLDVVGRQQLERAESFLSGVQQFVRGASVIAPSQPQPTRSFTHLERSPGMRNVDHAPDSQSPMSSSIERARDLARQVAREGANFHSRAVLDLAEQAYLSAGRLSQLAMASQSQQSTRSSDGDPRVQLEELRTLGAILTRLGAEAHAIQQNTGAKLMDLNNVLEEMGASAQASPRIVSDTVSSPTMESAQMFDFVRLAGGFAQDVASLARQTLMITQEMRAGLAPFRLEAGENAAPQLYTPGASYNEPTTYGSFGQMGQSSPR